MICFRSKNDIISTSYSTNINDYLSNFKNLNESKIILFIYN